jgi:hypothetical protein
MGKVLKRIEIERPLSIFQKKQTFCLFNTVFSFKIFCFAAIFETKQIQQHI